MSLVFIAGGIALATFLLAYLRAGRFGVTVLAIGAGYLLTILLENRLIEFEGLLISGVPVRPLAEAALILAPGFLALLFSHKQSSLIPRLVAALALTLFVGALLLPMMSSDPQLKQWYGMVSDYREEAIIILLGLGIVDVVFSRLPKASKHKEH